MPRIRDLGISVVPAPMVPEIGFNADTEPLYRACETDASVGDKCENDTSCSEDTAQCLPHSGAPRHNAAEALSPAVITQLKQHLQQRLCRMPHLN